ncbi:MAG: class I SAM-dependent methyltransferase [Acidimicrobiia bacterium]
MDEDAIWGDLVSDPWVRFATVVDGHSAPFGAAAMDSLEPLAGASVLDVGCGVGGTTWQLGERVGPDGRVLGVDVSAPFIDGARARGTADHVTFVLGDAATIDLDSVDAVFSRFGVMFFPDPEVAFTHLRSSTRPGGALAFAAWQGPSANPWMTVPVMASAAVLGPPHLQPPGQPGPFAFAEPDTIRALLGAAGWVDVDVTDLSVEQPFPAGNARGCAEVMSQLNPALAGGLRDAPERRAELLDVVADALGEYERDGEVVLPAAAWIVHATG